MRFPGEDGGKSLAEMAQRDLDAALQLLADRAQYITGAGGAAIALRRAGKNDLLCRASAGSNAPELGALLSTEFGLSGESVRTRRALRCDDAERDARVNREVCRELGIASVVVMPVVDDDHVLGVFELFSSKANAFGERDLTALERLSQMVETAVRLARAAESVPEKLAGEVSAEHPMVEVVTEAAVEPLRSITETAQPLNSIPSSMPQVEQSQAKPLPKPLFWSVALSAAGEAEHVAQTGQEDRSKVPPGMRNLHKCEACGFPVSAGRALCVECEEKKWRGHLKRPAREEPGPTAKTLAGPTGKNLATASPVATEEAKGNPSKDELAPVLALERSVHARNDAGEGAGNVSKPVEQAVPEAVAANSSLPEFVLSAGLEPSQSWLARNKYVITVILLAAAVVAGFVFLR